MKLPILLLALLWQPSLHAVSVTIGTGGEQGIYYQVIKEFCRLAHKSDPTVQCKPQASSGSIENLRLLQAGEIPYALVQSDWLYQASQGTGPFARQPQPELRTLFANSTSKCDTRLCRLTVLFEYLDRLPESETFPRS